MLSDLYQKVLSQRDIGKAFDYLIRQLGDLILDTPEAPIILGTGILLEGVFFFLEIQPLK